VSKAGTKILVRLETVNQAKPTASAQQDSMSLQKPGSKDQQTRGGGRYNRCIVLIFLGANLPDIIGQRGCAKLSVIVKELESINATHVEQPHVCEFLV
jgi:hypothetical protein